FNSFEKGDFVKKVFAGIFALALSGPVFAQTAPAPVTAAPKTAKVEAKKETDPVIIKWGGREIHQSELDAALSTLPAQYQAAARGAGKRAFAEDYLRMKMLASEAEKNGLDRDPEVKAQLQLMHDNALANAQLNRLEESINIPDAEVQKYYDDHKKDYEQVKARHILIAFTGSDANRPEKAQLTEEQAKAKADAIRSQIARGEDFAKLAKTESYDVGSGLQGGDLGTFRRGQMVPEFENAAFGTKVGDVSPVFRTKYGYHILQVQERTTTSVAEAHDQIVKQLKQDKLTQVLEQMKKDSAATFDTTYFDGQAKDQPKAQ
ncbi:MAG: peptidylprolyl isomerase, partial [Acidobacteriota bacterium]